MFAGECFGEIWAVCAVAFAYFVVPICVRFHILHEVLRAATFETLYLLRPRVIVVVVAVVNSEYPIVDFHTK